MKIRSIRYYIGEAFVNLFKNRLMTVASVLTVSACIFILSVSFCLALNIDYMLEQLEKSLDIAIYLDDTLDANQVNDLYKRILDIPHIKKDTVNYVSYEKALQKFAESMNADPEMLEGLPPEFLPRSFEVEVDDIQYRSGVIAELKALQHKGVYKIGNQEEIVSALTTINSGIRIVSLLIIAALMALSVLIITNTIKLTVNTRKTEISIMKYVGATDWFIRWPFVIEGVLIGLIGAAIPLLLSWLSYRNILSMLQRNFESLQALVSFRTSFEIFSILMPVTLILGTGIGIMGSVTSMRKYLRV